MEKQKTLREQFEAFDNDQWENTCYNFYAWFCKDSSLKTKAKGLFPKAKKLAEALNIDLDTHYVFFKNNCPAYGKLYDSFSFVEISSGDVKVWCTPATGHLGSGTGRPVENKCEVVIAPDFGDPKYTAPNFREVLKKIKA